MTVATETEEPQTAEATEAERAEAFDTGYKEQSTTETPATTQTPAATEAATEEPPPKEPEPVTPIEEFVQLTKAEHDDLLKLKGMMGKLDEGFGTLGNVHQLVKQLQAATAEGKPLVATEDDLKEVLNDEEGFPILGKQLLPGLNRILSRFKGTGPAPVDTDAIIARAKTETRLEEKQARQAEAHADLLDDHPDYLTVVRGEHYDGKTPVETLQTPFNAWVAKQPEAVRHRIWNSDNPAYLSKQLTKFKAETAPVKPVTPKTPTEPSRTNRLTAAVVPPGVTPGSPPPEDNGFDSGFKSEAKSLGLR